MHEGGWSNDEPWVLQVSLVGDMRTRHGVDEVYIRLMPQTMIDHIVYGGGLTVEDYGLGIFQGIVGRIAEKAYHPKAFLQAVRENMKGYAVAHGVTKKVFDTLSEPDGVGSMEGVGDGS